MNQNHTSHNFKCDDDLDSEQDDFQMWSLVVCSLFGWTDVAHFLVPVFSFLSLKFRVMLNTIEPAATNGIFQPPLVSWSLSSNSHLCIQCAVVQKLWWCHVRHVTAASRTSCILCPRRLLLLQNPLFLWLQVCVWPWPCLNFSSNWCDCHFQTTSVWIFCSFSYLVVYAKFLSQWFAPFSFKSLLFWNDYNSWLLQFPPICL